MKITSAVIAHGPAPGKAYVNVGIEFDGPQESITICVVVPNDGTEAEQKAAGMKRAKQFAQRFIDFPNGA